MQSKQVFLCPNGHKLLSLCFSKECNNPSIICQNEECLFSEQIHRNCPYIFHIQIFQQLIIQKKKLMEKADFDIMKLLDSITKMVEMCKQEFLRERETLGWRLEEKEKILWNMLVEGPINNITPGMVDEVMNGLWIGPRSTISDTVSKAKEVVELKLIEITKHLQDIRELWKIKTKYKFDTVTCHQLIQLSASQSKLKTVSLSDNGCFVLMSPPITEGGIREKKVRLKIIKSVDLLNIGIARRQQLKSNKYQFGDGKGVYTIRGSDGHVYDVVDRLRLKQNCQLRFSSGNIVQISFDPIENQIAVFNQSNGTKGYIKLFEWEKIFELCFCVGSFDYHEVVEIIDQ